jgi:hypothetical protein
MGQIGKRLGEVVVYRRGALQKKRGGAEVTEKLRVES